MPYYAHSSPDPSRTPPDGWQLLGEHLRNVAQGARIFARNMEARIAGLADAAHAAGLLHDLGKYRREFQLMLEGKHARNEKTYHKQAGAAFVCQVTSPRFDIAFAIAGHHGGIPDRADLVSSFGTLLG